MRRWKRKPRRQQWKANRLKEKANRWRLRWELRRQRKI
jgi:hypothetical protein